MRGATIVFSFVALALFAQGCGGGTFANGEYEDTDGRYRVGALSASWDRVSVEDQNDLAWHNASLDSVIQVNASCDPDLDIPLVALTNHLLIGFTERELNSQELVPLASREALRTHLRAKLDGVTRELVFHVLKKNACVYDFALVAPPGEKFTRAQSDYAAMVAGFRAP